MIVVDSSVWIARLRGLETEAIRKFETAMQSGDIVVGDLVLLEVLRGARDDRHAARIEAELQAFPVAKMLNARLAVSAARHFRYLRGRGITVRKTPDLIIGTFCIENDCVLLQQDRDFRSMADELGLRLL